MALERTTPSAAGVDAGGIVDLIEALKEFDLHSLMVARDGEVIAEGWADPYSSDGIQLVYSCSKSFTATGAGFLVTDGVLDVATKVLDHLPWDQLSTQRGDVDPIWEEVRLEHCLSMTLGHVEDAWGPVMSQMQPDADFIDAILAHAPVSQPGTVFCYNQVATYLAARVIEAVAGEPLLDLLRRRFFEPLGVGPVESHADPKGRVLGFSGFHVRTEALLALAQLYLDEGRWGDEQLLSSEWVARARTPYGPPNPDPGASEWANGYGFSFWKCTHGYRGDGAFGQFALVLPEQNLAVAITSETPDMQGILEAVWAHLLPAVGREGAPDAALLAERLEELRLPAAPTGDVDLDAPLQLTRSPGDEDGSLPAYYDRAELAPDGDGWVLTLHDQDRAHRIPIGRDWERTTMEFEHTTLAIAAQGGWADDDRFVADIVAVQTPHRFRFEASRSGGEFAAVLRLPPLGGADPARIGLPGTGGRAPVAK